MDCFAALAMTERVRLMLSNSRGFSPSVACAPRSIGSAPLCPAAWPAPQRPAPSPGPAPLAPVPQSPAPPAGQANVHPQRCRSSRCRRRSAPSVEIDQSPVERPVGSPSASLLARRHDAVIAQRLQHRPHRRRGWRGSSSTTSSRKPGAANDAGLPRMRHGRGIAHDPHGHIRAALMAKQLPRP